jgi:hypothetical protein
MYGPSPCAGDGQIETAPAHAAGADKSWAQTYLMVEASCGPEALKPRSRPRKASYEVSEGQKRWLGLVTVPAQVICLKKRNNLVLISSYYGLKVVSRSRK